MYLHLPVLYFNPLSPCGERRHTPRAVYVAYHLFQSTLPMRGETENGGADPQGVRFQSTLPMRGETDIFNSVGFQLYISIHSPHAGRDKQNNELMLQLKRFQSTLPMRGETHCALSTSRFPTCYFNPLSPCGERHGRTTG